MCTCRENSRKKREFQKNFCFIDNARAFDCVDHNKLWKILQEMAIPDNLTCLLRNLCRSRSNSYNWTWSNRLVPNRERYADDITLMAESEEELKSLLIKVKEESEKAGLKLNIQKTKIMASGPITSWRIGGETVETVTDFIFLGSKITADGDCSHEIKRRLLLGRKSMLNLDSILKSREITFADKGPSSQSYDFSSSHVWM